MTAGVLPATGSVRIGVSATPDVVWTLVSDPAVNARFSPELQSAHVDGDGAAALGAVIVGRNERSTASWTTRSTVVECLEPTRFAWAVGGADEATATWSFDVRAVPGGAELRHSVVLHAGREPLASAIERAPSEAHRIVEGRMAELLEGMAAVVAGIAALAEGEVRRSAS